MEKQKKYLNFKKGFTLMEMLIVIGIIAILVVATIVVVKPGEKLANARNNQREVSAEAIYGAIEQYVFQYGEYPDCVTTTQADVLGCEDDLVPLYFSELPLDPICGDETQTGYYVKKDATTNEVGVMAYCAENEEVVTAGNWQEEPAWACGDNITDSRDDNVYPTVEIGTQCWTAKNMAYLPSVVASTTGSESTPYYYVYGYDGTDVPTAKATSNYTTYGVLYNWPAAMQESTTEGAQGVCPTGWHVPTDTEWYTLENYLATGTCSASRESSYDCDPAGAKLAGTFSLWTDGVLRNHANFGDSGFNAVPGGSRIQSTGLFGYIGEYSDFWSSSLESTSVRRRILYYTESKIFRDVDNKARGYTVRCVRD